MILLLEMKYNSFNGVYYKYEWYGIKELFFNLNKCWNFYLFIIVNYYMFMFFKFFIYYNLKYM